MDRRTWLDQRRATVAEQYDRSPAPGLDGPDVPISLTHQRFVQAVIDACPPGGTVLDAACGDGRYFARVLDAGRRVVGADQSAGMLAEAHRAFPDVELLQVGLQDLPVDRRFDGVLCIDAMEYVGPEDWPLVLARLRAGLDAGLLYLTVEQVAQEVVEAGYAAAIRAGWPAVPGETLRGGGYHHYPSDDRVRGWLAAVGLQPVDEAWSEGQGYGYWHLLLSRSAAV